LATHNIVGRDGELEGLRYLKSKGYEILAVNWRYRKVEIDIIAKYNNEIIIAEVKTRDWNGIQDPEEAVTKKKQKNIVTAANAFILEKEIDLNVRFDILSVSKRDSAWSVKHIEDAFYPLL
jgi:putative endonuclease